MMISFINEHHSGFGGRAVLQAFADCPVNLLRERRQAPDVDRLSVRAHSDIGLKIGIRRLFNENFQVYGVRKVLRKLQREGLDIARCTVARLMRVMGLLGITRREPIKTCVSDKAAPCRSTA